MDIMPCRIINFHQTIATFKATGMLLLKLVEGVLSPLEYGYGGDPEINVFVPVLMEWFSLSLDQAIWWTYAIITAVGFIVAVTGFLKLCQDGVSRLVAILGVLGITAVCYVIYDIYLLSFFALCFVPWLFVFLPRKNILSLALYCVVVGSLTVSINFLRLHTATALGLMVVSAILFYYNFSWRTLVLLLCFGSGAGITSWGINQALEVRNKYLDEHGVAHDAAHLPHTFWHNIYAGLGFITNDYGLYYSDNCSIAKVQELAPEVEYLSEEYEITLRDETLRIVKHHPQFVLKMLFAKGGILLYYLLLFANIGLVCAWFYRKPWYIEIPYWLAMGFSALPGIVTIPVAPYLTGFFTAATFYGIHSIVWAFQHGLYGKIRLFFRQLMNK
jgi:hypothetical protein